MGKLTFESGNHKITSFMVYGTGSAGAVVNLEPTFELENNYEYFVNVNIFVTTIGTTGSVSFITSAPVIISESSGSWLLGGATAPDTVVLLTKSTEYPYDGSVDISATLNATGSTAGEFWVQIDPTTETEGEFNITGFIEMIRNLKTE